jgi:hypothetical protein
MPTGFCQFAENFRAVHVHGMLDRYLEIEFIHKTQHGSDIVSFMDMNPQRLFARQNISENPLGRLALGRGDEGFFILHRSMGAENNRAAKKSI